MTVGSVCVSAEELEEGRILGMEVCTEEEFLDKIQTKFLRVFLHAIHCHLSWDYYFFKLTQPLKVSKVQLLHTVKEKGGKIENHTSSL